MNLVLQKEQREGILFARDGRDAGHTETSGQIDPYIRLSGINVQLSENLSLKFFVENPLRQKPV